MVEDIRCIVDWPGTVSFLKDVCTIGAALFAGYIGWRGLTTWERQTAGQQDHDLARRLLVQAYRYRDGIKLIRNPVMFGDEMPAPPADRAAGMSADQKRFYGLRGAYIARNKVSADAWDAIRPDLLEAEAVWGTRMKECFGAMLKLDNELRFFTNSYLIAQDPDAAEATKTAHVKLNESRRDVIFDVGTQDQPDDFESDLRAAVRGIEEELRPRLIQSGAKARGYLRPRKRNEAVAVKAAS